jgi:hypothetical protein
MKVRYLAAPAALLLGLTACSSTGSSSTDTGTKTTSTKSASAKSNKTSAASKPKPSPTAATRDNSTAKLTTLGAGSFTVGSDIPVGRYVITAPVGDNGNLQGSTSDDPAAINEVLGSAAGLSVPSVTSDLSKNETIKIDGLSRVTFTPATTKLRTSLSAGDWVVGLDIAPGRYLATPGKGESGNFVTYDTDGFADTNEVLGAVDGLGVPNVTVTLKNKQKISISGLPTVTFAAK